MFSSIKISVITHGTMMPAKAQNKVYRATALGTFSWKRWKNIMRLQYMIIYDIWCKIYGIKILPYWTMTCGHARHHGSRKAIIDASPWSLAFCKRPTGSGYAGTPEGDVYDALILPKDRCDTMIYADGLLLSLWFSCRSPSLHASLNERNPS